MPINLNQSKTAFSNVAEMIKHQQMTLKQINLKPTKIYDKFDISDIEGFKLEPLKTCDDTDKHSAPILETLVAKSSIYEERKQPPAESCSSADNNFMTLVKANQEFNNLKGARKLSEDDSPSFSDSDSLIKPGGFWTSKLNNDMIGLLTRKEREAKVKKYLDKKKRRKEQLNTMVRYECRKDLADRRFRFQGRFVKLEDLKELEKDYIFDTQTKKLIKPIFKTQKIISRYRSMSNSLVSNSNEDVSMAGSDEN